MSVGPSHLELKFATIQSRHPELVSGSIVPQAMTPNGEEWMLKQVQHDGHDTTNFSSTILDRTYRTRSASIVLISAIALAGFNPLGQTFAQFMIGWQR